MPKTKKLTDKELQKKLQRIIEKKEKGEDIVLKAIALFREIQKEREAKEQSERMSVVKFVVDDEKLFHKIGWSPYYPRRHKYQIEVLNCDKNEIVICAGKRGGKTVLCAYIALKAILEGKKVLIVAPTYGLADRVMEYLTIWRARAFPKEMRIFSRPPQKITTAWGGKLDCKSAEQPDQIMGTEYDVIIVDECSIIPENVWQRYIVPASGKKLGKYYYISTPFGRNWFWRLWRKAKENGAAFHWTSLDNPYFEKEKWDEAKKKLPEFVFRQEYMAEFLENALVFQGFDNCLRDYQFPQEYNPNHLYVMGVDLGKYETFTAISVIDLMTHQEVNFQRFQGDWNIQKERIMALSEKYGRCPIWIDASATTAGDVYVDELSNLGFQVNGYKIQGASKRPLIEKLIVLIQNQQVFFPSDNVGTPESREANLEMRAYTFEMTGAGNIIYKAPSGEYEDCVIARALACWELSDTPLPELSSRASQPIILPQQEY